MDPRIARLEAVIRERQGSDPASSYVASLFAKGRGKIAQKLGEEATETIIAALSEGPQQLTSEAADLLFHLAILLADAGLSLDDVFTELERREGVSGITEKESRSQ
jgi:phosphoribosyl-ATP pyrophosphohydrolase